MSKNIYQKMINVMSSIDNISKNGYNSFHKYDYVQEEDVVKTIREALIEQKLLLIPSCNEQKIMQQTDGDKVNYLTQADMEITIIDTETGESITRKWQGQGQDKGDKGLYKAYTGGLKYFLMKTFLIPTGDDPERDYNSKKVSKKTSYETPKNSNQTTSMNCSVCGKKIKKAVFTYSMHHYKKPLCRNCQEKYEEGKTA